MPRALDDVLADAMGASARLVEATRELRWEWDSRFSAVLCVVKSPRDVAVLELVAALFPSGWDGKTISQAPDPVRALASDWGLKAGQRLFTLDPADDPLFFAAWWPWGAGTTFSLRISCVAGSPAVEGHDPLTQLRRWFSL